MKPRVEESEKRSEKDFQNIYSTDQNVCEQQNACIFVAEQFLAKKWHSYLLHSTELPFACHSKYNVREFANVGKAN